MLDLDTILAMVRDKRATCDAAPPGPWVERQGHQKRWYVEGGALPVYYARDRSVATFIATARAGYPEALDLIEQLVARVRELDPDDVQAGGLGMSLPEARARYSERAPVPPGKMRVTASLPVAYDVSPGQIAAYLRSNGWENIDERQWVRDGWALTWLPNDTPEDLNAWLLRALSKAESRSTGEILRDIAAMEAP